MIHVLSTDRFAVAGVCHKCRRWSMRVLWPALPRDVGGRTPEFLDLPSVIRDQHEHLVKLGWILDKFGLWMCSECQTGKPYTAGITVTPLLSAIPEHKQAAKRKPRPTKRKRPT